MKCHLCLKDKKLLESHIIPEFLYKPVYDDLHRLSVVSSEPGDKVKFEQKGYRERLLCYDCEQLFSPLENYASRVLYGGTAVETQDVGNGIILRNVDYQKFKLFQLSLLWRASISSQEFFSKVKLGPHEETIRHMLLRRTPGEPHRFGCMIAILLWEENKPLLEMILQPEYLRISGHRCFRFVLGGCSWFFIVSRHSKDFELKDFFLSRRGELTMPFLRRDQYADLFKGFNFVEALKATQKTNLTKKID